MTNMYRDALMSQAAKELENKIIKMKFIKLMKKGENFCEEIAINADHIDYVGKGVDGAVIYMTGEREPIRTMASFELLIKDLDEL